MLHGLFGCGGHLGKRRLCREVSLIVFLLAVKRVDFVVGGRTQAICDYSDVEDVLQPLLRHRPTCSP